MRVVSCRIFFIRSARHWCSPARDSNPPVLIRIRKKLVLAAFYIKCLCFTETIVYNHQPDADTFVCKAGIEPTELREKYIKLLLYDFL